MKVTVMAKSHNRNGSIAAKANAAKKKVVTMEIRLAEKQKYGNFTKLVAMTTYYNILSISKNMCLT